LFENKATRNKILQLTEEILELKKKTNKETDMMDVVEEDAHPISATKTEKISHKNKYNFL